MKLMLPYTWAVLPVLSVFTSQVLADLEYPYPVNFYNFTSQRTSLSMAYMDVPANTTQASKGNIVLLHGKNFCGVTWNETIKVLSNSGYRVVIPEQIGFCKSTKYTTSYQFTLEQLAFNTKRLLNILQITNATIMGHSMGGMIAARYALMYPSQVQRLIMVNPLGLENWQALGVPYQTIDDSAVQEFNTSTASIKEYQQATYYAGTWKPEYDVWVNMLATYYTGTIGREFGYIMAKVTDMIFTQPVVYELSNLKVKTLLMVGDKDNTAIGKAWAPADVKPLLGHYEVLGKQIAGIIPGCTLIEYADLGHAPQIQDPVAFHEKLMGWLG